MWDTTCVDTLAPSHLPSTACCAGAAAAGTENLKRRKYNNLISSYVYEPFGFETLGPWCPSAHLVFRDISKRLVDVTRGPPSVDPVGRYTVSRLNDSRGSGRLLARYRAPSFVLTALWGAR